MKLDKELTEFEQGAQTDAERDDEESEIEDVAEFQNDEEFAADDSEADLEDVYKDFYFSGEGPEGEGDVDEEGNDGGLAASAMQAEGVNLSEEGFHLIDDKEASALGDYLDGVVWVAGDRDALGDMGSIDADAEDLDAADNVSLPEPHEADDELDSAEIQPDGQLQKDDISEDGDTDDDNYEVVELELSEDDIVRYLEDDQGNRIGFVLLEEGKETSYYYVEDDEDEQDKHRCDDDGSDFDLALTKETVTQAATSVNAIYKDGLAVAGELKEALDDIKSAFDFNFLKK